MSNEVPSTLVFERKDKSFTIQNLKQCNLIPRSQPILEDFLKQLQKNDIKIIEVY